MKLLQLTSKKMRDDYYAEANRYDDKIKLMLAICKRILLRSEQGH